MGLGLGLGLLRNKPNFRLKLGLLGLRAKLEPSPSPSPSSEAQLPALLLHPHRNSGSLPGSLTPSQKFGTSPRVSYTLTEIRDISSGLLHPHRNSGHLPGSLTPIQDLSDTTAGLLHPNSSLCPTHINYFSFSDLNYESPLDVVSRTNSTHTHQEW